MRIVLDGTPLLGRETGVGRYVRALLGELPDAADHRWPGARVEVSTWSWRGRRIAQLPRGVTQRGLRVPARALQALWQRAQVPPVEALVGRTDVFHGTNFVSPPTLRAREVITVHDLTYVTHPGTVSAASLAYRHLVPRALRRGAHVVTPSDAVAQDVREHYGLAADRVTATRLGVDASWSAATPLPARRRDELGLPADYVVFVGSLDPRKNLPRLLEAFRAARSGGDVPDLVLAGPAGREESLAGVPGTHLTGWLDEPDLQGLVAGSAGLVLPSLDEGFGLPVLEALAAGRPVLAADIPALREVGGDVVRYADPLEVDGLTTGLLALGGAPDDDAARAARRQHAAGFTWRACAEATVRAYARVLGD
ncbi:glycosyltransferase family 1 protein [Cellulomonas sp. NTE-D12]|uniref:glycosyltransferase family 4 protein n=1 Tax=Cellulomonas sp. NTE-D12 TaxID=2962632 RepID=UPI0030820738|nr:glycosyl transferase [Cellulomonas sp. NTE-D12]